MMEADDGVEIFKKYWVSDRIYGQVEAGIFENQNLEAAKA